MIEGVLRHCTTMEVDRQYVDSHGQSTVAFAFCHLLGFQLLPRLKAHPQTTALPARSGLTRRPIPTSNLVLRRPINWDLITPEYDNMNTVMIQRVLSEPAWATRLTPEDLRGLTPLLYGHMSPYGIFYLDMMRRLDLESPAPANPTEGRATSMPVLRVNAVPTRNSPCLRQGPNPVTSRKGSGKLRIP